MEALGKTVEVLIQASVLKSFCLFRNHVGILNCRGFWMMATSFSISSAVSSPARLFTSISAFLHMRSAKRRPRPLILVRAKTTLRLPSTLVFRIRRMCWNSGPCMRDMVDWVFFVRGGDGNGVEGEEVDWDGTERWRWGMDGNYTVWFKRRMKR